MKYIVSILFVFIGLVFPKDVNAHVLKTDGPVGAILHVSPDDDPIAGTPTNFYFELKDKEGKFTPEKCDCTASVLQNGKEIYSQPLFQDNASPSLDDASFSYTLPEKDVYVIRISGAPKTAGEFEQFTLAWDIRVARDATGQEGSDVSFSVATVLPYVLALLVVVIFVGVQMQKKKRGQNHTK